MTTFGEKLKQLRTQRKKSQVVVVAEIASMFPSVRISQTTLSALETRETTPRGDVLDYLTQYYDVPITYFFETPRRITESERALFRPDGDA